MKRCIFLAAILMVSLCLHDLSYARMMHDSSTQLMQEADLVISGVVIKVEQTKKVGDQGVEICCATIKIDEILKGEISEPNIIVEFISLVGMEPDVQSAQYFIGDRGKSYLRKLPNGHYKNIAWFR